MKTHKHLFTSKAELNCWVDAYFKHIEGEYHIEKKPAKKGAEVDLVDEKVYDRDAEEATMAGLAFYLGFNSRAEFDGCETSGKYSSVLKRARLRIEAVYEQKLHRSSATGAMFVLKSMGWNEKTKAPKNKVAVKSIKVKIVETGPQPAASEKEVVL